MSKEYNDQIKELISYLEESKLTKLVFKKGDMEIQLEKGAAPLKFVSAEPAFESDISLQGERGGTIRKAESDAPGTYVKSPMVGTFYSASAPDQPPFVKVGDRVTNDTVVCIIEAMKVMNEVKAGVSGTVAEVLSDNAHPVEFGTRLFRIIS